MHFYKKNESNTWIERVKYLMVFLHYGILVNIFSGNIRYLPFRKKCLCRSVDLIRHGKTEAIEKKEFMSDTSCNARLSDVGKAELSAAAHQICGNLPDAILVGPLKRTMETLDVLETYLREKVKVDTCGFMRGINNALWAGKTFEMLDSENLLVFLQRECSHNIFAKSRGGDSWGDVIYRCIKLLNYLNRRYRNEKVLIISQGSIFQGMKIVLHLCQKPWEGYSAEKMFSLTRKGTNVEYGQIQKLI